MEGLGIILMSPCLDSIRFDATADPRIPVADVANEWQFSLDKFF
jgi:hypothetical protein